MHTRQFRINMRGCGGELFQLDIFCQLLILEDLSNLHSKGVYISDQLNLLSKSVVSLAVFDILLGEYNPRPHSSSLSGIFRIYLTMRIKLLGHLIQFIIS